MKSASLQEQLASGELDPRLAGFKRACLSQWYSKRFLWYSQTNGISSHNGIPGFLLLVFEALLFSRNHGWNLMELHQVPIAYAYAYDQAPIAYDQAPIDYDQAPIDYAYAYDQVPIAYDLSKTPSGDPKL